MKSGVLMRRREVMEMLGVTSETVAKMAASGTIEAVRLYEGARAYFLREQVERLVRKGGERA